MASPTQRSHQKRTSKAFIPAVPILPGQKSAKPETQVATHCETAAQSSPGPTKLENVSAESPVVPPEPTSSAHIESPAQDEPSFVTAATEISNPNDSTGVGPEEAAEEPEVGAGVTLGEAESSAAEVPNLVQPQNEAGMDHQTTT